MNGSSDNSRRSIPEQLVVATTNEHKFREISAALGPLPVPVRFLKEFQGLPESPETGQSFAENARQKAAFYSQFFEDPVLAEDSGLLIPALGGFPGLHSSRVAPDDPSRIALVLDRLRELQGAARSAYYVCSMVVLAVRFSKETEGRCDGEIAAKPAGGEGFGYDPIFRPEGLERTFGQMPLQEKTLLSHRGKAGSRMRPILLSLFGSGRREPGG